jgi:hypothetical protein
VPHQRAEPSRSALRARSSSANQLTNGVVVARAGHILAGTIKDVRTRFAHQTGFHVPRNFGWDTHGMPIEFEVDKMLGIKGKQDVLDMGIKACVQILLSFLFVSFLVLLFASCDPLRVLPPATLLHVAILVLFSQQLV